MPTTYQYKRCWYRISIRFPHHWLCQKPIVETAAVLLCHLGFRPVWGYGSVLSYDGFPAAVRLLSVLPRSSSFFRAIVCGMCVCVREPPPTKGGQVNAPPFSCSSGSEKTIYRRWRNNKQPTSTFVFRLLMIKIMIDSNNILCTILL